MKSHLIAGLALLVFIAFTGCDDADKKKAQVEQERTKQGTKANAGDYKAVPLDLSMDAPKPTTPNQKENQ